MDTYHVVLYIHFVSLVLGAGAASVVIACALRLRVAETVADAIPWGMLSGQAARIFPIVFLGLFGSGAYLASDLWTWKPHWIQVGIVGLVLVGLQGPLVAAPRASALKDALKENGPGPLGELQRRLARDPRLLFVVFANPLLVLAVAWMMTEKSGTGGAVAALIVAEALGALAAWRLSRPRAAG